MDTYAFRQILHSLKNLTSCQLRRLDKARQQLQEGSEIRLNKRLEAEFTKHPLRPHCHNTFNAFRKVGSIYRGYDLFPNAKTGSGYL